MLAKIDAYWASSAVEPRDWFDHRYVQIAGTEHDQPVPDGVQNPYWDVIQRMPCVQEPWKPIPSPYPYQSRLGIRRDDLVCTYAWSIPSPGDIAWLAGLLDGRGVVEIGAGSGYWAWQLAQAGIDVAAYEPNNPESNRYVGVDEPYHPLLRGDETAAAQHPDRALLLSWPSYAEPWAAQALACYEGDLLVYVGEGEGGCCADDKFFALLEDGWSLVGSSPHHVTWWAIHCGLSVYRRGGSGGDR